MGTIYGTSTGSGYWRLEIDYTITESSTYYAFVLNAYRYALKADTSGYDATKDTTSLYAGGSSASGTPTWNHANDKGQRRKLWGTTLYAYKTTYPYTLTFGGSNYHPSGTMKGTSTASTTTTINALASYSVTYSAGTYDNVTNLPANTVKYNTVNYTVGAAPTKPGWTFKHWSCNDGYTYAPGASCSSNQNLVFTAVFEQTTYYINFISNIPNSSQTMPTQQFYADISQPLSNNTFTYTNYLFAGWSLTANGEKIYNNNESVTNVTTIHNNTVNLYALWVDEYNAPNLTAPNATRAKHDQASDPYTEEPFGEYGIVSVRVEPGKKRISADSDLQYTPTRVTAIYYDNNEPEIIAPTGIAQNYYTVSQPTNLQWIITDQLDLDTQYNIHFIAEIFEVVGGEDVLKVRGTPATSYVPIGAFLLDASPDDDSIGIFTSAPNIRKAVVIGLDGDIWFELENNNSGSIDEAIAEGINANYWDIGENSTSTT